MQFDSADNAVEKGVLVDGTKILSHVNDDPSLGGPASDSISIGTFTRSPAGMNNEVIVFAPDKVPVLIGGVTWTFWRDTVQVPRLSPRLPIQVELWIVNSSALDLTYIPAPVFCQEAHDLWEGHGLDIQCSPWRTIVSNLMVDATTKDNHGDEIPRTDRVGNTVTADYYYSGKYNETMYSEGSYAFQCVFEAENIKKLAFQSNKLNVYFLNAVDIGFGPVIDYGVWCPEQPEVIAMGFIADYQLASNVLAHEIGHALMNETTAAHVDNHSPNQRCDSAPDTPCAGPPTGCPSDLCLFDRMNVMHSASDMRKNVTEGQIFRAFFNIRGALNRTYQNGPGGALNPSRQCSTSIATDDKDCPAVQKRLWQDSGEYGPWRPN